MSLSTPSEDLVFIVTNEPGKGWFRSPLALCRGGALGPAKCGQGLPPPGGCGDK